MIISARYEMKEKNVNLIVYAMVLVAVVYSLIQGLLGNAGTMHFKITLGIWIAAAVFVIDFVAPLVRGELFSGTYRKNLMYILYAVADAAMYVFLYIFVINITMSREPVHYVYLGVAAVMFPVRVILYRMYTGTSDEESEAAKLPDEDDEAAKLPDEDDEAAKLTDEPVTEDISLEADDVSEGECAQEINEMIYRERKK